MARAGTFDGPGWEGEYLSRAYDVEGGDPPLRFTSLPLRRAALKYGRAVAHAAQMARHIAAASAAHAAPPHRRRQRGTSVRDRGLGGRDRLVHLAAGAPVFRAGVEAPR